MSHTNPDETLLLIRCPSCGQRFKVGEDLRKRTVECGGCEHRFRITDDVIVRGIKFYPGERKDSDLHRFQRVPLAIAPVAGVPGVRYAEAPNPAVLEPASPQRIVAGIVGGGGIVFMALLLILGSSRGGALDGMTTENRLLMAGFTAFLGLSLLVYANPRARMKAALFGLLMSAGLISLPFFFTTGSVPLSDLSAGSATPAKPVAEEDVAKTEVDDLRNRIGTKPLENEIARLAAEGSAKHAVGLWLRGMQERNRILIRDYITRTTGADGPLNFYPRDKGDYLMVIVGTSASLEEMAKAAAPLGSVQKIHNEIAIVEVRVNNENFVEGPIEKLNNRSDPAFYDLNKRELESIEPDRVSKAVKRLAEAEPKVYRADISRKLVSLLGAKWVDFKGDVCRALAVWAESPGPAGEAALVAAKELLDRGAPVPQEMVALMVKEKTPGVIPVVDELWSKNATRWESLYGDAGPAAEATMLRRFTAATGALRHSAVRILGQVGGADSLPMLESALRGADPELRVLIEKASESIRARLAR